MNICLLIKENVKKQFITKKILCLTTLLIQHQMIIYVNNGMNKVHEKVMYCYSLVDVS
jgi:hypothetical protein